jgi:hypothetical protein
VRPEDLGIQPFDPASVPPGPAPPPRQKHDAATEALVCAAEDVRVKVGALATTAEAIGLENVTLRSALSRALASVQRLTAELFHLRRALEEARRHRALLFWIGLALLVLSLARR